MKLKVNVELIGQNGKHKPKESKAEVCRKGKNTLDMQSRSTSSLITNVALCKVNTLQYVHKHLE